MCVIPFALAQRTVSKRTLTFAERVAYQRAIEEVYWHHRIWPKSNASAKPPLDKVMSQAEIEKKVEDYMRDSQALEDSWQRPITAEQLQAEIDRIAQHTKQPEVLRELFAALGNDPFVIAECLARPALAERLTADLSAQAKIPRFESAARIQGLPSMPIATALRNSAYTLPRIFGGDPACTDEYLDSHHDQPSARCPRISHGSVDRERNDRLGRRGHQRRPCEHRRQIQSQH